MNYLSMDLGGEPGFLAPMGGVRILSDPNCLADTTERNFPASRHRSGRIHKKLVKRFGGEFRKEPAIFKIGRDTFVAHPAMYAELQSQLKSQTA